MIFGLLLLTAKSSTSPSASEARSGSTSVFPTGILGTTRVAPFSGASGSARIGTAPDASRIPTITEASSTNAWKRERKDIFERERTRCEPAEYRQRKERIKA